MFIDIIFCTSTFTWNNKYLTTVEVWTIHAVSKQIQYRRKNNKACVTRDVTNDAQVTRYRRATQAARPWLWINLLVCVVWVDTYLLVDVTYIFRVDTPVDPQNFKVLFCEHWAWRLRWRVRRVPNCDAKGEFYSRVGINVCVIRGLSYSSFCYSKGKQLWLLHGCYLKWQIWLLLHIV